MWMNVSWQKTEHKWSAFEAFVARVSDTQQGIEAGPWWQNSTQPILPGPVS